MQNGGFYKRNRHKSCAFSPKLIIVKNAEREERKVCFWKNKKIQKLIDFTVLACYNTFIKCGEQKPVGLKELGESCRSVRGKEDVLHEFILLAVR